MKDWKEMLHNYLSKNPRAVEGYAIKKEGVKKANGRKYSTLSYIL